MANEKFYVTQEGYNDLVNEHENLVHKVRQEVIVELQEARAQGDLSENADYDAAREHQAQVEGRIRELEAMIKNAEIISEVDNAEDLNHAFPDIAKVSQDCKFRTCTHTHEPSCAVKPAVEEGIIASFRYENYLQFLSEIENRRETYKKVSKKLPK